MNQETTPTSSAPPIAHHSDRTLKPGTSHAAKAKEMPLTTR